MTAPQTRVLGRIAGVCVAAVIAAAGMVATTAITSAQGQCTTSAQSSCRAPGASSSSARALIGSVPPTTTGENLTGSGTLSLSSLLGKPTAMVFWLNTCPHCQKALPAINRLAPKLDRAQLVTAAIDAGVKGPKGFETPAAAVKTMRLTVPTILVPDGVAQNDWHVTATPTAYIIDSGGTVTRVLQPKSSEHFAGDIKAALASTQ